MPSKYKLTDTPPSLQGAPGVPQDPPAIDGDQGLPKEELNVLEGLMPRAPRGLARPVVEVGPARQPGEPTDPLDTSPPEPEPGSPGSGGLGLTAKMEVPAAVDVMSLVRALEAHGFCVDDPDLSPAGGTTLTVQLDAQDAQTLLMILDGKGVPAPDDLPGRSIEQYFVGEPDGVALRIPEAVMLGPDLYRNMGVYLVDGDGAVLQEARVVDRKGMQLLVDPEGGDKRWVPVDVVVPVLVSTRVLTEEALAVDDLDALITEHAQATELWRAALAVDALVAPDDD